MLQDYCLDKDTHFVLSNKYACKENSILRIPYVLLSSHGKILGKFRERKRDEERESVKKSERKSVCVCERERDVKRMNEIEWLLKEPLFFLLKASR